MLYREILVTMVSVVMVVCNGAKDDTTWGAKALVPPHPGGGGGAKPLDVAALLAVGGAYCLSPFMKIHQAAVLAHRFCFSLVVGRGSNTLRTHRAIIFNVECCGRGGPQASPGKLCYS